jgi:phosphoribosyl-dephospho-CoA transferase
MRWTDPSDGRPRRHARVWLDRAAWRSALRGTLDASSLDAVAGWIAAGRAFVVRRRDADAGDACCLGVALPLAAHRRRIGLTIDPRAIARVAPPLTLAEASDAAPADWHAPLADLRARASRIGIAFHVYGSLAWQAISGEPCLLQTSDLDLLWTARDADEVHRVIAMLAAWEAVSGVRADGELLLANGDGIAWRELRRPADRVLVKHCDGVSLQPSPAYWQDRLDDLARAA